MPKLALAIVLILLGALPAAAGTTPEMEAALTRLGDQVAAGFARKDKPALDRLIDLRAIGLRAARDAYDTPDQQTAFAKGFADQRGERLFDALFTVLDGPETSVKMLRLIRRGVVVRPLLRFDYGDLGLDYWELVPERQKDGSYRVVDWYRLSTGSLLSRDLGGAARLALDPTPGLLDTVLGVKRADARVVALLKEMGDLERAGNLRGALQKLGQLPPEITSTRLFLQKELSIVTRLGDDAGYYAVLARLAKVCGKDPSCALLLLDHHLQRHEYDLALADLAMVESRVGSDSYIEMLRATVHHEKKSFGPMVEAAGAAIRLEPELENAYFLLALGHTRLAKFAKAIEVYEQISAKFGYELTRESFEGNPDNAELVESPEFRAWIAASEGSVPSRSAPASPAQP